jgi:hypothetical protein
MSNFEVFKCTACNRQIEKLVDQIRAPINKCTITYKCTGSLIKVSQSDTKTMTSPAMDVNLTNWVPRGGAANNTSEDISTQLVNINSAQDVLSLAINDQFLDNINELEFTFEVKRLTNASFVEYFYNRPSATALISGQDDSSKRLALRFANGDAADRVVVYLNGVELDTAAYDRSVSGRIVFKAALVDESNQIRVLVFKQDAPTYVSLNFVRNDLSTVKSHAISAWGNVQTVEYPRRNTFSIFTCTDTSNVQINSRLILSSVKTLNNALSFADDLGYMVIADAPYSSYDRNLNNAINLRALAETKAVIEFKKDVKNSPKFYVFEEAIQSMFPPIAILSKSSDDVDTNKTNDSNTKLMNAFIT